MASPYKSMPAIPTPQDILKLTRAQRAEQMASGNMAAQMQALSGNLLDALFGNPDAKRAGRVHSRMQAAQAGLKPVEGDDDVSAEMRRLAAMRDAVSDIEPALASQLHEQLVQLGTVKLERDKLKSQIGKEEALTAKAGADTVRAGAATAKSLAETSRLAQLLPGEIEKQGADVAQSRASAANSAASAAATRAQRTNWLHRETGKTQSVLNTDLSTQARLAAEGWIEMGNPQLQGSQEEIGLTKPVQTTLQEAVLNAQQQKDTLSRIAQGFKPEFLTVPKQVMMATDAKIERWTGKSINSKHAADREQYWAWSRNVLGGLNEYIKYITGAQAAVAEYERIEKAYISRELSPTQFVSSLRELSRHTLAAEKRAQLAMASGLQMNAEQLENCKQAGKPCPLNAIPLPSIDDSEVDAFLATFGIPARKTKTTNEPFKGYTAPNGAKVLGVIENQ